MLLKEEEGNVIFLLSRNVKKQKLSRASGHVVETSTKRQCGKTALRRQINVDDGRWRGFEKLAEGAIITKFRIILKLTE